MKVNYLMSGINLEKKRSLFGLFQDIYTLLYDYNTTIGV